MSARFRIRTSQGQEISFASHEMFAEFVRSGELSPDDVVYDAETREWSSALTHPVVLQIELESEESDETETADATGTKAAAAGTSAADTEDVADDGGDADEAAGPSAVGADIGLELAPEAPQLSPDEAAAAFVKKMEAERASERDFDEEPGFKMEQGSSGLVGGFVDAPQEAPPATPAPPPPSRRERPRGESPQPEPPEPEEPRAEKEKAKKAKAKKAKAKKAKVKKAKAPRRKKAGAGRRYAPFLMVAAVAIGAGVVFGPELISSMAGMSAGTDTDSVELPPPPPPLIPDTENALRERAQERYLTSTRALLRDLPSIPSSWLSGSYLATPSDYPEVRQAWNDLLTQIRQIRAGDNERYRAGYARALDEARVDGSARTLRLAAAVADFQGDVAPRAAHYDRVEALALAALRGHDALVEAEGTIAYEPATTTPVSGDPVIEAVGRNEAAQALLDDVLDMILAELEEPTGPGRAANLGEWIWDGMLGAVAN